MKHEPSVRRRNLSPIAPRPNHAATSPARGVRLLLALHAVGILSLQAAFGFRDDFDDGNDDGWTRFDPLSGLGVAAPAQFTFPDGGYRIVAPAPAAGVAGPARAFSFRADMPMSDFFMAADIVNWNDGIDQAFGFLARGGNIGPGQTTGYVCNYDPNQDGTGPGDQPGGQFQINIVTGEASERTIAAANIKLTAGRSYRMVFRGVGADLFASIYDLGDLTMPLVEIRTVEGDPDGGRYPSGFMGVFNFYRGDDETNPMHVADTTWDNFVLEPADPNPEIAPGVAASIPGQVNVTGKSPASYANFHPAEDGLVLALTSLGVGAVDPASVALVLNGTDVTADLQVAVDQGTVNVAYDRLEPHTLYHAVLTAANMDGAAISHPWTFDTFEAAKLGTPEFKVVEMEDYNYESGKFKDDPPPEDYLGLAGTPDIDYADFDTSASGEYRFSDFVSTKSNLGENDPEEILTDTERPAFNGNALDYIVNDTESGEWLNYTRQFVPGEYLPYLRLASRYPQNIRLQRVESDPTRPNQQVTNLGVFRAPSTVGTRNFVYVPLTDDDGNPVMVQLQGESTLRVRIDGPNQNRLQRNTLFLNYLMFALDPASAARLGLRITHVERDEPLGETRIRFNSVPGRFYSIEYKADLSDATWEELEDLAAAATETTFIDADPERFGRPNGYYRVREP